MQIYNKEDIEKDSIRTNHGLNPKALPLIDNSGNMLVFIDKLKDTYGDVEISDLSFHEDSVEFSAYIMYDLGFSRLPKGSITIVVNGVNSIVIDNPNVKEFTNGDFKINIEEYNNIQNITCTYSHSYNGSILLRLRGEKISVSEFKSF